MNAADTILNASTGEGLTGWWLLAVFLLALAVMAWLTVREASLYESRTAIRNLRKRNRRGIPHCEQIPLWSRFNLFVRSVIRGGDIVDLFQDSPGRMPDLQSRLLREIEKMTGKSVYLGSKEQLKPPSRPAAE